MKKTVLVLFTFFYISFISLSYASFPDIASDNIYKDAIEYVQKEGIVNGFSDGTYRPYDQVTRGEFTKIIINALYKNEEIDSCLHQNYFKSFDLGQEFTGAPGQYEYYYTIFPDLYGGFHWCTENGCYFSEKFSRYVCVAKENEVINGFSDGTFKPNIPITVGESIKIIVNAFDFEVGVKSLTDPVFEAETNILASNHVLPESLMDINSTLKRGEMAEIIYRLQSNITNKKSKSYAELVNNFKTYRNETLGVQFEYFADQINSDSMYEDDVVEREGMVYIVAGYTFNFRIIKISLNPSTVEEYVRSQYYDMPYFSEKITFNGREAYVLKTMGTTQEKVLNYFVQDGNDIYQIDFLDKPVDGYDCGIDPHYNYPCDDPQYLEWKKTYNEVDKPIIDRVLASVKFI